MPFHSTEVLKFVEFLVEKIVVAGIKRLGYSVLPFILLHGRAYAMVLFAWEYRSVFTFHRRSHDTMKVTPFLCCCWRSCSHMKNADRRITAFPSLLNYFHILMLSTDLVCEINYSIDPASSAWDMGLLRVMPPILHYQTFL